MDSKPVTALYWILTILFCLALGVGGVFDALLVEDAVKIVSGLGYPNYFLRMLGVWKILGVLALLAPGVPRLKEWAYAGFAFDLIAASVSHASVGDATKDVVFPLILLGLGALSYALRPEDRRMYAAV